MMDVYLIILMIILFMALLLGIRGLLRFHCLGKCSCCPFSGRCCRAKSSVPEMEKGEI